MMPNTPHDEMKLAADKAPQPPWYRQPYLLLVLILPLVAVVASLSFVNLAFKNRDFIVKDNWYLDGKALQQDLTQDVNANRLKVEAHIQMQPQKLIVKLVSPYSLEAALMPATLTMNLSHATNPELDQVIALKRQPDGVYAATLPLLKPGKYFMDLIGPQWRLRQHVKLPLTEVTLHPLTNLGTVTH